jgi:hypothetical protein
VSPHPADLFGHTADKRLVEYEDDKEDSNASDADVQDMRV